MENLPFVTMDNWITAFFYSCQTDFRSSGRDVRNIEHIQWDFHIFKGFSHKQHPYKFCLMIRVIIPTATFRSSSICVTTKDTLSFFPTVRLS